jgi:hypothetical protein
MGSAPPSVVAAVLTQGCTLLGVSALTTVRTRLSRDICGVFSEPLQAEVVTVPKGDSTTHGAEYYQFSLVAVAVRESAFTTVRS